jgi:hypothetical protein
MDYEPSTGQFRTRALPGNSIVASSVDDSVNMQDGHYRIRESDLPIYAVIRCAGEQYSLYALQTGQTTADLPCRKQGFARR